MKRSIDRNAPIGANALSFISPVYESIMMMSVKNVSQPRFTISSPDGMLRHMPAAASTKVKGRYQWRLSISAILSIDHFLSSCVECVHHRITHCVLYERFHAKLLEMPP